MRAEVEVDADVDHVAFGPYAIRSGPNRPTSILTLDVRDSHEFVRALQVVVARGLNIKRAELRR